MSKHLIRELPEKLAPSRHPRGIDTRQIFAANTPVSRVEVELEAATYFARHKIWDACQEHGRASGAAL